MRIISCPEGLLFDNMIRKCNYINLVTCNGYTNTMRTTTETLLGKKIVTKKS
jgi:hypothetical protein